MGPQAGAMRQTAPSVAHVAQDKPEADLSAAPSRFVPMSIDEALRLSKMFYDSGLMPKHFYEDKRYNDAAARRNAGIAGVCTMVLYGAELGLSPMQAIRMMHVVEGRPVLAAAGKVALVKRSGKCRRFDVIDVSDDACTCETVRIGPDGRDEKPRRLTVKAWRSQGAAPKGEKDVVYVVPRNSTPWQQYPSRMLKARCSDWLCGEVYEDVVAGLYSAEEIVDYRDMRSQASMLDNIFDMVAVPPVPVHGAGQPTRLDGETAEPEPAPEAAAHGDTVAETTARSEHEVLLEDICKAGAVDFAPAGDLARRGAAFRGTEHEVAIRKAWTERQAELKKPAGEEGGA